MRRIALALWIGLAAGVALAETASIIDPTDALEPSKPPRTSSATPKPSAQSDAAPKRERAEAEQRRRAKAQARAREAERIASERKAAERESARLRVLEQARQEAAAREAAARKAAATQAAQAARASAAKAAAARLAALREAAARELAERDAAAREAAAREKAMKEEAARQLAAKEEAAKQAAAKEAADRLIAAREAARREGEIKRVAVRNPSMLKDLPSIGTAFRDCVRCPELVWLPQGEFVMGEASAANGPRQIVAIRHRLAVGRFEVTFAEWDACVAGGGCRRRPNDAGWGRGWQPVINVSWTDAQQYAAWLSRSTGKRYRLLTEAEWEYAARAGTDVRYWWGDQASRGDANCAECGSKWDGRQAAPVGRFAPNPFGLHDMHGNVSEWVEDCYHERCNGASDTRVLRGGAWYGSARSTRSTSRTSAAADHADNGIGFRVARTE